MYVNFMCSFCVSCEQGPAHCCGLPGHEGGGGLQGKALHQTGDLHVLQTQSMSKKFIGIEKRHCQMFSYTKKLQAMVSNLRLFLLLNPHLKSSA